jgi:hypothetical protein
MWGENGLRTSRRRVEDSVMRMREEATRGWTKLNRYK